MWLDNLMGNIIIQHGWQPRPARRDQWSETKLDHIGRWLSCYLDYPAWGVMSFLPGSVTRCDWFTVLSDCFGHCLSSFGSDVITNAFTLSGSMTIHPYSKTCQSIHLQGGCCV